MDKSAWIAIAGIWSCLLLSFDGSVFAQDVDRRAYDLFNPVPREHLRPLSPEPTPITVDPGRVQVQTDVVGLFADRRLRRVETWDIGLSSIRIGLLHNLEGHLILEPYRIERFDDPDTGERQRASGFGDTSLGLKLNLWGNEGETRTAMGIMGYVRLPTSRSGIGAEHVEGGVLLPWLVLLGEDWELWGGGAGRRSRVMRRM